ncbi:MAG TPA: methyltransferase domain-containing protein [Verrucomicrobiota bacterium]|nr:methyltransferase domain-containing protein [Verrucomicrobiota bacterium]HNT15271.1 methyltransferase domain-containing protein [Verrucomicrobiota bacterium]
MEDPREARRLAGKVDAPAWVQAHYARHARSATRVLDVGCGPGVLAAALAQRFPHCVVTGLDASETRLAEARSTFAHLQNAQTCQGEATKLPFANETFDFVYCRFLLEYLPDKEQAVREMVRVCRSEGTVLLQDLDGQLLWHHPEDPILQADLKKVLTALEQTGFDPFVGRKLFFLASSSGLSDIEVRAESYHLYAGCIDEHNLRLWETKLDIALPAATKALGSAKAAESLKDRFLKYLQREDTLTYSTLFTVTGRKRREFAGSDSPTPNPPV